MHKKLAPHKDGQGMGAHQQDFRRGACMRKQTIFAILLAGLSLSGCGNSGDNTGSGGGTTSGTGTQGVSVGVITGFGSVFVNGVEFRTTGAGILIDDNPGQESDLRIGMKVRVTGSFDPGSSSGIASRIEFNDDLEGPVASIDVLNQRLVVLGQTVVVDAQTIFDNVTDLAGLAPGEVVEVSGFRDDAGAIRASRIERRTQQAAEFELKGTLASLIVAQQRFSIGAQTVSYTSAQFRDLSPGGLANGQVVEVKGTLDGSGVLIASQVSLEDGVLAAEGQRLEVEGIVNTVSSGNRFTVNGQVVQTGSATIFEQGSAADIVAGLKVEAEGTLSNGVLVASKVAIQRPANLEIEADVQSVDAGTGAVTVLGVPVLVNAQTLLDDKRDGLRPFTLTQIQRGDHLEIRGLRDSSNRVVARRLERQAADTQSLLQGPVSNPNAGAGTLSILGIPVQSSPTTQFRDRNEAAIPLNTFFSQLTPDSSVVKAKGLFNNGLLTATEMELED